MKKYIFLFAYYCFIASVKGDLKTILDHEPCLMDDNKCFTNYSAVIYKALVDGDKDLGIVNLDPAFLKTIDGTLPLLKYTLYNTTLLGFRDCKIEKASMDSVKLKLKFDMLCPKLNMSGVYEVNGTLVFLPVHGTGDFWVDAKKFKILVDIDIDTFKGEDDKDYVSFKSYKYQADLQDGFDFDITNLFGGNRFFSDSVIHFARRNWKMVARQLQDPPIAAFIDPIIENFNTILKHVPLDKMIMY